MMDPKDREKKTKTVSIDTTTRNMQCLRINTHASPRSPIHTGPLGSIAETPKAMSPINASELPPVRVAKHRSPHSQPIIPRGKFAANGAFSRLKGVEAPTNLTSPPPQNKTVKAKTNLKSCRSYSGTEKKNVVGDYHIFRTLGKGSQAVIKLGMHVKTGKKVAIKVMSRMSANKLQFQREALALRVINHKHVIQLKDAYESSKYLFLILEYCPGGDLFDYVINKDGLERKECLSLFSQVVRAVMHSHKLGIIHRDIKPENILLSGNGRVVLTDFGLCGVCANDGTKTLCGSPHYASPELCKGLKYDFKSDSWSLGVLLYTMMCASYPFEHKNINKLISKITLGEYSTPPCIPEDIANLIGLLLVVNPRERLPVGEIWKADCFYEKDENLYFFQEDLAPINSFLPVEKKDISNVLVKCLRLMGWGDDEHIIKVLTSSRGPISYKRIQYMYNILKESGAGGV
mmetsp:Transcript_16782/g.23505  ORF Transcript_16782/g.23505 Transcript_16782/m.23505 type:complete len:460 (-) Transcript_16782:307-1686(-)